MKPQPVSFDTFFNSIWLKIPEVWRNSDSEVGRPLQILTLTMAQQMYYYFYLKISAMDELFDPDLCPKEYLVFLSSLVGWKLIGSDPDSWRQQIKHAPLLYKIKGTEKSIVLAEKLIGYSVFMTELYRDYTGAIVPKERLFNSFPLKVKIKPWFRTTSSDTQKHIFTDAFSDLFPSFNEGTSTIDALGALLHPKSLRRASTKYVSLSSMPGYNPKSGANSLARLAKLPRINLILKKDKDLDHVNSMGVSVDATANEALALLLQFKPFHVYINNLVVMYSLTDYLFGSASAIPGDGSQPGDAIILRESFGIVGSVAIEGNDERISYRFNGNAFPADQPTSVNDPSINKGNILIKYRAMGFTQLYSTSSYITDANYLTSLGMSLKGYNRAILVDKPDHIWNNATDFVADTDALAYRRDPKKTHATRIDKYEWKYSPLDFTPTIGHSFISLPFNVPNVTHLHNFVPIALGAESVLSLTPTPGKFLHDTVTIEYTKKGDPAVHQSVQNMANGNAWSIDGITKIRQVFPTLTKLSTGTVLNTPALVLNEVYSQGMLLIVSHETHHFMLQESDFKLDSTKQCIIFNMYSILSKLEQYFSLTPNSEEYYLPLLKIHVVYAEKESAEESFNIDSITRGTSVSSKRHHKKFTRYNFVDTSLIDALQHTQSVDRNYELNSTGTIEEDFDYNRGYNTELPVLFTRKTLFEETRSGESVLSIPHREPRNEALWTVLNPAPSSYVGAYPVITDFFANFYNLDLYSSPYDSVPYNTIDMSAEAQIVNRSSVKWKSLVSKVSPVQKEYFLLTRDNDFKRTSRWTRGSALKTSKPFIGASRAHTQPFRSDITSFNRKDNLRDYATSSLVNYPHLGNYCYSATNNSDMTFSYFSLAGTSSFITPATNEFIYTPESTKTLISTTGDITYPSVVLNISQYDVPSASLSRDKYYSSSLSAIPSFSMYAGNIRFDVPPLSGELFTTLFDSVDIDISGLEKQNLVLDGVDLVSKEVTLDYNTYIVWREINTGATVNIGLAPDVPYTLVRSNIRLLHNGIELSAGSSWTVRDNPVRLVLDPGVVVEPADTFNVEFETLGTPVHNDPRLAAQTGLIQVSDEVTVISSLNPNYLKVINFVHSPVVEWKDVATLCGWSEASNNATNVITPFPLIRQDTAVPNVDVVRLHDSIMIDPLTYGVDWQFRAIPDTVSYRIQLSQRVTDLLEIGNSILVTYKHR